MLNPLPPFGQILRYHWLDPSNPILKINISYTYDREYHVEMFSIKNFFKMCYFDMQRIFLILMLLCPPFTSFFYLVWTLFQCLLFYPFSHFFNLFLLFECTQMPPMIAIIFKAFRNTRCCKTEKNCNKHSFHKIAAIDSGEGDPTIPLCRAHGLVLYLVILSRWDYEIIFKFYQITNLHPLFRHYWNLEYILLNTWLYTTIKTWSIFRSYCKKFE